jgi:isopentenyl-diphosphate delta-isomerase
MSTDSDIAGRKTDHLRIATTPEAQMRRSNGLDTVQLEPMALPELSLDDIDTSCHFLQKPLRQPLLIASMSGGVAAAERLNSLLATAAEAAGVALGLGSMRIALDSPQAAATFNLRRHAPNIPLLANLGATQLLESQGVTRALRCVDIAAADALIIHLNPLQEAIQPGGNTDWRGVATALAQLVRASAVPVIVKEVGHGIGPATAKRLLELGVTWVDVAGAGGTSWAGIEQQRAAQGRPTPFHDFGISLTQSLRAIEADAALSGRLNLIASGGIRSGLDVAKTLRLGARLAAAAQPFLLAAQAGEEALHALLATWQRELAITCLCTGSASIAALRNAPLLR